jgi:hypothetical protein
MYRFMSLLGPFQWYHSHADLNLAGTINVPSFPCMIALFELK